ncbi:META domain-containing protein [uncultured Microscilla sp.]|uniref:META domain-containing protein n=1 Tax=uncultured Microscilla sp. TaxID=432653 RepID=UPI0026097D19|nr:META domain-containing protein [uncultured Microscilla sp.]
MKLVRQYINILPIILLSFMFTLSSCDATKEQDVTPVALDGTWQLIGYQNTAGKLEQNTENINENPIIAFKQGDYGGSTLHNAYTGSYTLINNQYLVLTTPVSTLTTESQWGVKFLESLPQAENYSIDNQLLYMALKGGEVRMVFQKMK